MIDPDRNVIFYDQTEDDNGAQWVLQIIPADVGPLDTDRRYVRIAADISFDTGSIKAGYESRPCGKIETPVIDIKFDLDTMDINSDMQLLRDYLTKPIYNDAFSLDLGDGDSTSISTATFFRLMCDEGGAFAAPDPEAEGDPIDSRFYSHVLFEGAQRVLPSRKYDFDEIHNEDDAADETDADVTFSIKVYNIVRISLEAVKTWMLCTFQFNTSAPVNDGDLQCVVYEILYYDEDRSMKLGRITAGGSFESDFVAAYTIESLFFNIRSLAQDVYRAFCRSDAATLSFSSTDETDFFGTPIDHIGLREQNHLPDGGVGPVIDRGDVCFKGAIWGTGTPGDTLDDAWGGLLAPGGQNGKETFQSAFKDCWEMLGSSCLALGCKMQLPSTTASQVVYFAKILENTQSGERTIPVSALDGKPSIEESGRIIASAKIAIPGLEGDDESEYTSASYWGTEAEQDENVGGMWHTVPRFGAQNQQQLCYSLASGDFVQNPVPGIAGNHLMLVGLAPHSAWGLIYYKTPNDGTRDLIDHPVLLGVSSTLSLDYGGTLDAFAGGVIPLPTLAFGDVFASTHRWWDELMGQIRLMQREGGLPQLVAEIYAFLFGNPLQVVYSSVVMALGIVIPAWIGEVFTIGSSGTANCFLKPPKEYLGHLSTEAVLAEIEVSKETGDATCTFIHVQPPI